MCNTYNTAEIVTTKCVLPISSCWPTSCGQVTGDDLGLGVLRSVSGWHVRDKDNLKSLTVSAYLIKIKIKISGKIKAKNDNGPVKKVLWQNCRNFGPELTERYHCQYKQLTECVHKTEQNNTHKTTNKQQQNMSQSERNKLVFVCCYCFCCCCCTVFLLLIFLGVFFCLMAHLTDTEWH